MRNGHCCVLIEKKFRNRQTDYIASADDNSTLTLNLHTSGFKHLDDSFWSARKHTFLLLPQRSHIQRMEAIHILFLCNSCYHLVLADMLWQRKLHKDSVYRIVRIKICYEVQQFSLGNCIRLTYGGILYSNYLGSLCLTCHIRDTARVLSYQNHNKMRHSAIFFRKGSYLSCHFLFQAS